VLKAIVKSNLSFLLPYAAFLLLGSILMLLVTKTSIHLHFNAFHNSFFDSFSTLVTNLGEGTIVVLIFIILLAVKFRYALIIGLSNIISALITQGLKHTIFSDALRPKKFFEGIHDLYFVPGVENWEYNSFPSGHTTCAFALYCSLALITENRFYKVFLFFVALTVGYSRIYLSQHFFEDVYAGSMIGVITSFVVFWLVTRKERPSLEGSLTGLFKK
jgi:membrane-associated phospholipid phosphatase